MEIWHEGKLFAVVVMTIYIIYIHCGPCSWLSSKLGVNPEGSATAEPQWTGITINQCDLQVCYLHRVRFKCFVVKRITVGLTGHTKMHFMYVHDLFDRETCMMMRSRTRSTQINQACAQTTWAPSLSYGPLAFCEGRSVSSGLQQLRVICALVKEVRVCSLSGVTVLR